MQKLTAFIVDDIPTALELLCTDIQNYHPEIEIIGKASSVVEAAKLLSKQQPDLLFLDIMLGDGTGFDVLEILPNLSSKIIFVTASDEYAIKAFKFAAIDYILKPYSLSDLNEAIAKAKQHIQPNTEQLEVLKQVVQSPHIQPNKISLHTLDRIIVVNLDEIIRCESDNNYTKFFLTNGQMIMVTKTLKSYAVLLKENGFLRVHQSHLVNLTYVKEYIKSDGGYLVLTNKSTVPVSVRKRSEVLDIIGNW